MPKNILIFRFPYESAIGMGGEEKHIISLAKGFMARGSNVSIFTSCSCLLDVLKKIGIPYKKIWGGKDIVSKKALILFPFICIPVFINLCRHLIREKVQNKIDTLYCLTLIEKILITPVARILGLKVIWGQHTKIGPWLSHNPLKFFFWLWSGFTTIVVPSNDMKKQLIKLGIKEKRIHIIPYGLDIEELPHLKILKKMEFQKKLLSVISKAESNTPLLHLKDSFPYNKYIGCVSRLSREKGIFDLLKAISQLVRIHPYYKFLIVGEGNEREKLETEIKKERLYNNVYLLGYKNTEYISYFLDFIDIFVLPSPFESFGISFLEALYFKKPIIASRAGGPKDWLKQRINGLLFTPNDSTDLAKTIEYMMEHTKEAKEMAEEGYKTLMDHFTLEKVMDEWEKI